MKTYTIAIEETIVEEFKVVAKNRQEALEIAEDKYKKGEFIISKGEVQLKQMAVISPKCEITEWSNF
ncbi:MAG: hypothetical protein IKV41_02525 [Oscillospiraceae bacterium]|nr:hypothetical protein [Oscillospiraceae bacterium]